MLELLVSGWMSTGGISSSSYESVHETTHNVQLTSSRANNPRESGRNNNVFYLALEIMYHHFCSILLITQANPDKFWRKYVNIWGRGLWGLFLRLTTAQWCFLLLYLSVLLSLCLSVSLFLAWRSVPYKAKGSSSESYICGSLNNGQSPSIDPWWTCSIKKNKSSLF